MDEVEEDWPVEGVPGDAGLEVFEQPDANANPVASTAIIMKSLEIRVFMVSSVRTNPDSFRWAQLRASEILWLERVRQVRVAS